MTPELLRYLRFRAPSESSSVCEQYGTENFSFFIYSIVRMLRPKTSVELGTGLGAVTLPWACALKELGEGTLWSVDNGIDWESLKASGQGALGYSDSKETYETFISKITETFSLKDHLKCVHQTMTETEFFDPQAPIDLLFTDAPSSSAVGCLRLLRYYLPKMNWVSQILIDRASTIHHSFLLLESLIDDFNNRRIPASILEGLSQSDAQKIQNLVWNSKWQLVHLTDHAVNKKNPQQNSRAWIKIEPFDLMPRSYATTFF